MTRIVARIVSFAWASDDMSAAATGPGMAKLALIAPDRSPMPRSWWRHPPGFRVRPGRPEQTRDRERHEQLGNPRQELEQIDARLEENDDPEPLFITLGMMGPAMIPKPIPVAARRAPRQPRRRAMPEYIHPPTFPR